MNLQESAKSIVLILTARSLCQKNKKSVKIKQKPVTMGDRTSHRTLSPERTSLQNGINE
jgi:hypothetical protein